MNLIKVNQIMRWMEVFAYTVGIAALGLTLYANLSCTTEDPSYVCQNWNISQPHSLAFVLLMYPLGGILNSTRVYLVHQINQAGGAGWQFQLGLHALVISYILFSVYRWGEDSWPISDLNLIRASYILTIFLAVVLLMTNSTLWREANAFVRIRLMSVTLHLTLISLNPFLGVVAGLYVLPIGLLVPDNINKMEETHHRLPSPQAF